jgi:hypothetical protein
VKAYLGSDTGSEIEPMRRRAAYLGTAVVMSVVLNLVHTASHVGQHLVALPAWQLAYVTVVVYETESPEATDAVENAADYAMIERAIEEAAMDTYTVTATNVKRIGAVNHDAQVVFLFNYFFADDTARNLAVWEYTAGWFQKETGLDNSTVLLPREGERSDYNIINHCRWDRLRDVLPSLLFKRSFRSYVLANFEANRVAAMPILYRTA